MFSQPNQYTQLHSIFLFSEQHANKKLYKCVLRALRSFKLDLNEKKNEKLKMNS